MGWIQSLHLYSVRRSHKTKSATTANFRKQVSTRYSGAYVKIRKADFGWSQSMQDTRIHHGRPCCVLRLDYSSLFRTYRANNLLGVFATAFFRRYVRIVAPLRLFPPCPPPSHPWQKAYVETANIRRWSPSHTIYPQHR